MFHLDVVRLMIKMFDRDNKGFLYIEKTKYLPIDRKTVAIKLCFSSEISSQPR